MRESPHSRLQALARTPDQVPPDALWQRLRAGQRRAVLRRRLAGGATASALALLLVAVLPWPLAQAPTAPAPASVATHDPALIQEQIVSIDRALQVAYARGASDEEVAPMWQARNALAARTTL